MIDPRIPQNVVDLWGKVLAARSVVSGLESDVTAAQAAVTKAQDALALAQAALAQGRVPLDDAYKALRAAEDAMFVGPLKATTPNLGASPFK